MFDVFLVQKINKIINSYKTNFSKFGLPVCKSSFSTSRPQKHGGQYS